MKILWFTIFGIPPVGIFVFLPTVALVWEQAMDKQEEREKAIRLFHVNDGDISDVSFKVMQVGLDRETYVIELPSQDADYYMEGAFRTTQHYVFDDNSQAVEIQAAERYTGSRISDWRTNSDFKAQIVREKYRHLKGEVFFSPSTQWVYFNFE